MPRLDASTAKRPMPRLMRLYVRHSLIGFGLAVAFTALLLAADVGGLRHLVTHTAEGPLAVLLLVVFNGIVFAGAQFGIAVTRLGSDGGAGGGNLRAPSPVAMPVAVPVGARAPQSGPGTSSVARP